MGPEFLPLLAEIRDQLPALQHCIFTGDGPPPTGFHSYEALIEAAGPDFPPTAVAPEDFAALFYTRGTTGVPGG